MRAGRPVLAVCGVIALAVFMCAGLGMWQYSQEEVHSRVWQHEAEKDADPSTGPTELPGDFLVDGSFASHLPVVVIDTGGREIVNYKYYDSSTDSMKYPEGVDVYTPMTLSVIDNENHVNHPTDAPAQQSQGKLKVRGNHSAMLAKLQYRIKLLTEDGEKNRIPILGMEPSDDWVLNGTQSDRSHLRTYLGMNFMGTLQASTPDVRFCEVLMKEGERYRYQGLYMFLEPVSRGEGRVDIDKYDPSAAAVPYLARRDRYDKSAVTLDTWLSRRREKRKDWDLRLENDAVIELIYPNEKAVTAESLAKIEGEIDEFERILYSEDAGTFVRYRQYIDMESFCDYFLINEFMASYDAGVHSTYFYKDTAGRITMGPVWDFDGCADNVTNELTRYDYIVLGSRPWYEQMVKDPVFVKMLTTRFGQLRAGLLSDENIEKIVGDTVDYLGNAVSRDTQRWRAEYAGQFPVLTEEETGLSIWRDSDSFEKEVKRVEDFLILHARFMDQNLPYVRRYEEKGSSFETPAILCLLAFFIAVVLVQRSRRY
ncbi:CotH kinase family protein [Bacilliculturomica massiliensis]|uniref:CotH kinase family protein n=1 Tax=Bacilliculturomica massiliensis TaxID=1917867 RepID=UPI001FE65A39|nr:CotH kinase family protein [Bacilliculturomica massiliensis]